jgi:hypothetical protein
MVKGFELGYFYHQNNVIQKDLFITSLFSGLAIPTHCDGIYCAENGLLALQIVLCDQNGGFCCRKICLARASSRVMIGI